MPEPKKGETERDFLSRCIPMLIHEGKEQKAAVGACYGIYRSKGDFPSPKPNSGKKSNPGHNNPGHNNPGHNSSNSSNPSNSYRKKLSRSDKIRIFNYF